METNMSNEKEETVVTEETAVEAEETEAAETAETAEAESEPQPEPSEAEVLRAEKEALAAEVNRLKNDYARAYADTENMKKRLEKDFEQRSKYRIQDFAREILPVLDNCERENSFRTKQQNVPHLELRGGNGAPLDVDGSLVLPLEWRRVCQATP